MQKGLNITSKKIQPMGRVGSYKEMPVLYLQTKLPDMKMKCLPFFLLVVVIAVVDLSSWTNNKKKDREFYQLTAYHFTTTAQEKMLDAYFQNALLPALHRKGVKIVGVFKSWANDTAADKLMYVFIPLRSLDMVAKIKEQLK